ncbi:disease resistance protein [Tanacetum coccineum]
MDDEVSMDQPSQTRGFFTRLKKLSFRPRPLSRQSNTPPLLAEFKDGKTESSFPKRQLCRRFSIAEICSATRNFNKSLLIGKGGFGDMYKGTLKNGTRTDVAIKRRFSESSQGDNQFLAEVEILPMLRHPNIVCLIGYCDDDNEMILVYEYMSNETLGHHLHEHSTPISWLQRLKICIDVARGLDYLHNGTSGQGVIHRDIKSSNILLDNLWAAKISDFGVSYIIPSGYNSSSPVTAGVVTGTIGFIDPEYMATGRVSTKSDVYSFGVVLLEVLCRKRAWDKIEPWELVKWAEECLRNGKLEQITDPEIRGQISVKCLNDYARILECCLRRHQEERITMAEVVFGLESILALQEKTDYSINQTGITISDYRLQKYFFSTEQNAGEAEPAQAPSGSNTQPPPAPSESNTQPPPGINNSLRGIKLLSVKSRQPKEDLGHMSDSISEIDAISEMSLLDGLSDAFHEEFMSRDRTEFLYDIQNETASLYDMMQLDYIQQAGMLTRMKDFLHLIWFYPMKKEADINLASFVDKFSSLKNYIRMSQDSSTDGYYLMEIQTLLLDVEELLNDAAFDMVAYLPEGVIETLFGDVPSTDFWLGVPEIHSSTIVSARDQALRCINDLKVKIIGISGTDAWEVADALNDLPELQSVFDMVLFVRVKDHNSMEELLNHIEEEIHRFKRRSSETGNIIDVSDNLLNCLLFVDCSEDFIDLHEIEFHFFKWFQNMQIVMTSGGQDASSRVDLEIRIDDHLLPWILFSTNVDLTIVGKYSRIQQMAKCAVEQCHGHLLAIILLARALKAVVDISVWELALEELASRHNLSSSQFGPTSDVMVKVLRFIWSRMETMAQKCIIQYALLYTGTDLKKPSLIHSWVRNGLVKSEQEGACVFDDLVCSFLLEHVGGDCVRMRDETRVVLVSHFVPRAHGFHLKQDGSKSKKMPNIEEWDAREIHLTNNMLSELPDNPKCPILVKLFLHSNQDLMDIPVSFFDNMPTIQVLDLSSTSIKCLPSSIRKLTTLQKLFIRNCDLMMELPPEIGALKNLKAFDSEGTQLVCIPEQFGSLTKLECLKCSLYKFSDTYKQSNRNMQIIPVVDLSKLVCLKELSIIVDSYTEWWENEVKVIIDILPKFRNLESLRLYIPTTELLHLFMEIQSWEAVSIYQHLSNFRITVGHIQQRVMSRLPRDLDETFLKLPKCLKYANGEGNAQVVARALKHANALFLDRHWTIQSLSTFGLKEMDKLKFCLLVECNEMLEIFNIKEILFRPVLELLEYLSVHSMRSLSCIWNGPIHGASLSNLKTLVIHACPELTTVLTYGLLGNLTRLENFIVEDCLMISSLVGLGSSDSTSSSLFLPSLKKISLVHLPELISISCGISIAPRLESLVVYDCPNLEKLSSMEVSDQIKEIKGENEWWDGLQWCEPEWTSGQPDYLAKVFTSLGTDGDIMDELAEAANFLALLSD